MALSYHLGETFGETLHYASESGRGGRPWYLNEFDFSGNLMQIVHGVCLDLASIESTIFRETITSLL